jgi:TonB-linked SusC/RagA family outer membrane protein
MNKKVINIFLIGIIIGCRALFAQDGNGDMIRGKLVSDTGEELISAIITEIDKTDRVISNTITDINGDFSMKIKSAQNRLKINYLGFETKILPIGSQRVFQIVMKETNTLAEVVIVAKKTSSNGTMDIPANEVSFAMQKINTKIFEGLQVNSIDDALQGQIAGLDVVGSGNLGQGSSMRIRGTATISANAEPLIVINGVARDDINTEGFEFGTANEQQFADLLSLNPDDISDIAVLKDAASTAVWGSRGANGVILITTKKGVMGPTRVTYTYKFLGSKQPAGIAMLNGDEYTMLMKQAYFNKEQKPSTVQEFNYDPYFPEYRYYNGNTAWRDEVIQFGHTNDHYLAISGGGEKANFRITGGYLNAVGTVIGQKWDRWTSRTTLDYNISSRIAVGADFDFSSMDNNMNWENLLDLAYKKMPNQAVYRKDLRGNDLNSYYAVVREGSNLSDAQKDLKNPVALGNLAINNKKSYTIQPTLRLKYDLIEPTEQMLRYKVLVSFRMNTDAVHKFLPKEISSKKWEDEEINRAEDYNTESFGVQTENSLQWQPFASDTHSLQLFGAFKTSVGSSNGQKEIVYGIPSHITDASSTGYIKEISNSLEQSRSMSFVGSMHYAYKSKYIADVSFNREGCTQFGRNHKWGNFPGVSLRWNISDEPFMDFSNKWLDMFSLRPSFGIVGNRPGKEYMHYSQYKTDGTYAYQPTIRPDNVQLTNLRWETKTGFNLGMDMAFLDYTYVVDVNAYHERRSDILFADAAIPTTSGFDKLAFRNGGTMDNDGWEFNFQANKFVQFGDFSLDFNVNLAQSVNTLIALDEDLLQKYNEEFLYGANAGYLGLLQVNNSYGSIYGFKSKGVYQYGIESYNDETRDRATGQLVRDMVNAGTATMPVFRDAKGKVILDSRQNPIPMYYNFGQNGKNYQFQGGDAIYEDINHDGNIDDLDIVYLGNSNPLLNGGFGFTFRWKQLSCKTFFTFRYGYQIINQAKRNAENMYNDYNQSKAVNLRWRQNGDETEIPRALRDYGYNWLPSDRFVEDGSFLRFKYLSFNYNIPVALLKKVQLKQMSVYATFNNLMCFTNYTGVDPEVGIGGLKELGKTVDNSSTPRSLDFTLGVTVGF